jgi:putative DNA primase/helicase
MKRSIIGRRNHQQEALIAIAQKKAKLWHTPQHVAYADVIKNGARITYRLDSVEFSRWLQNTHHLETGQWYKTRSIKSAIFNLSLIAKSGDTKWPIFNRVGKLNGRYYLDLGTPDGSAVEYSAAGWQVIAVPPVRFERAWESRNCSALPIPVSGGNLEELFRFMDAKDEDRGLLISFLVKCLLPGKMEPILILQGRSSALAAETLKRTVDPCFTNRLDCVLPARQLATYAETSRILLYEYLYSKNLSLSVVERIVSLSTGYGCRQWSELSRPQILACVNGAIVGRELQNQSLMVELQPIPKSYKESVWSYWSEFEALQPQLLGALLDAVCHELVKGSRWLVDEVQPLTAQLCIFS